MRPRLLVALPLALLTALLTACGSAPVPVDSASAVRTPYDPALHAMLPTAVRDTGLVRVGTDATYPPASSFAKDGRTIIGFEPDLAAALGRVLGVELRLVRTGFTESLPALGERRLDAVMSAMTDTAQRQQEADFVDYFSAGTSILVQRGNPHGISQLRDLCGRAVAAERGTTQVDLLSRAQQSCEQPIEVREYPDNAAALVELRTGRAAAVLNDYPPAVALTTGSRTSAEYQLASTVQYEPGFYGIAVRKSDPGLRDALREALERLLRSGEYGAVLEEWGVSSGAVQRVTVNSGA